MELKKLLQQAFEAGNNSAQMPSDYWEGIDRDFEEWYLEYAAQKLKACTEVVNKNALLHGVSGCDSDLKEKHCDTCLYTRLPKTKGICLDCDDDYSNWKKIRAHNR